MKLKLPQAYGLVAFGVCLYVMLTHLNIMADFFHRAAGLVFPILVGMLLAFVLAVPHRCIERWLNRLAERLHRKPGVKLVAGMSLLLTLLAILMVVVLVVTLLVPALVSSGNSARAMILDKMPEVIAYLNTLEIDPEWIRRVSEELRSVLTLDLSGYAGKFFQSVAAFAFTTAKGIATGIIATVIAIYILLSKHDLARQGKKLLYAFLTRQAADYTCYVGSLINRTYSRFLTGQCTEAFILGGLIFLTLSIAGIPYASIVAVLTSVFSFIPYIGAFMACFMGTVLVLLVSPVKALACLIIYQVVQMVENQFIYPHVVGSSVGLPPLWTMVGALIGGKLLGIVGMIFFIPATSVVYTLLRDIVNRRLEQRGMVATPAAAETPDGPAAAD